MKEKEKGDVTVNKISKGFFIFLMILISLSMIQGATYKINQEFNLTTSCLNFTCDKISLTVLFPNGSLWINNQSTEPHTYYANYILNPQTQGDYLVYFSDGVNTTSTTFSATSTGYELNIQRAIVYSLLLFVLIFLFVTNIFAISKLPSGNQRDDENELLTISRLKYLRLVLIPISYFFLMAITFLSSNIALSYLGSTLFGDLFFSVYLIMARLLLPIIFIWVAWLIYVFWTDMNLRRMMERGIPTSNI